MIGGNLEFKKLALDEAENEARLAGAHVPKKHLKTIEIDEETGTAKKNGDLVLGFAHELGVEVVVADGGHWSSDREEMTDSSSQAEDFFKGFFEVEIEKKTRMARKRKKDDDAV